MNQKNIDDQLSIFEKSHENNWQHLIYNLRRHMDTWNTKFVKNPSGQMKHSYLPVLFNISINGSTATQIGKRSMVVRQNISRTIKELEEMGMIITRENKKDKRSDRLDLTEEAKQLVLDAHFGLENLQEQYKNIVGAYDWQIATEVLLKITAYHELINESKADENAEI